MKTEPVALKVVILGQHSSAIIRKIGAVIDAAGGHCVVDKNRLQQFPEDNPDIDIVIVEASGGTVDLSDVPEKFPVLAVVDSGQSIELLQTLDEVDDVVSTEELDSSLFLFRIHRLVDRYRAPVSAKRRHYPEFDLVKALVNTTRDKIYIKDLEHRFLFASDKFAHSNGLTLDEVIGKDDLDIGSSPVDVLGSPELGWLGFWAQDDAAVAGGRQTIEENPEWRALLEDTRQNRVSRVPLKNNKGEAYALIVCSSDVTPSDSNQVDLKARGAILDRALGAMQKAKDSQLIAERAELEKNKLLAAASHDLRQPLHAMGLFLDVLERRVGDQQQLELIAKIKRSSDALAVLFNSLLDISRLDAGVVDVDLQHFSIETLLSGLRPEFQEVGLQKSLLVNIPECNHIVYTDPILFERILRNLVQNAVTYTNEGSVQVICRVHESDLLLSVVDTGPGIPVEEYADIFSEYYQIESRLDSRTKGLGLGLAIVRRLADLLELKIKLESDVGDGSTFTVTVPIGEGKRVAITGDQTDAVSLDGQLVLIIDDESDIREGMANMLLEFDCVSITAESSRDALDVLVERDVVPDIIVADYRLKNSSTGDQAIADIREEFSLEIPAVIVTGDTSSERLRDAARSGCQLLHKPVQPAALIGAIVELISGSR